LIGSLIRKVLLVGARLPNHGCGSLLTKLLMTELKCTCRRGTLLDMR